MLLRSGLDGLHACEARPATSIHPPTRKAGRTRLLPGRPVSGRLLPAGSQAEHRSGNIGAAHDEKAPDDDELLNGAAVRTLRQGGEVAPAEPAQPPQRGLQSGAAAAILRY
jgi:hypothetical protein